MMKVYGVTYDHGTNYGSFLQGYALQIAIQEIDIAGEKCQYALIPVSTFPFYRNANPILYKPGLKSNLVRKTGMLLASLLIHPHFAQFRKTHMNYADCRCEEALSGLNNTADAFVCGSDVIWNIDFNFGKGLYFLDFAQKYKFSYAASFGRMSFNNLSDELYKKHLPNLNSIGLREKSAVEIVSRYTDTPASVNVDPVLLLKREHWDNLAGPEKARKKPYIFAYNTHKTPNYTAMVSALSKQTGLPVVEVTCGIKMIIKQKNLHIPAPQRWIALLRDAEYVVTNSFHGTAFCVLFQKKFFSVVEGEKENGYNVRLFDLLDTVGLKDRLYNSVPETIDLSDADFTCADEKIEQMRRESLDYLQTNLEAAYQQKLELENKEKK